MVRGRCHAPKSDALEGSGSCGVTVAAPAGAKSHPQPPQTKGAGQDPARLAPVAPYRLIALSPLSRAAPGAASPCRSGSPAAPSPPAEAVGALRVPPVPGGEPLPGGRAPARWGCRPGLPWEGARGRHAAPVETSLAGPARLVLPPGTAGCHSGGELDPTRPSWGIHASSRGFGVGGPFPGGLVGHGVAWECPALPRPLAWWLLGLVPFGVSSGNWVRSDVPPRPHGHPGWPQGDKAASSWSSIAGVMLRPCWIGAVGARGQAGGCFGRAAGVGGARCDQPVPAADGGARLPQPAQRPGLRPGPARHGHRHQGGSRQAVSFFPLPKAGGKDPPTPGDTGRRGRAAAGPSGSASSPPPSLSSWAAAGLDGAGRGWLEETTA